jgi:hypothetical protein
MTLFLSNIMAARQFSLRIYSQTAINGSLAMHTKLFTQTLLILFLALYIVGSSTFQLMAN